MERVWDKFLTERDKAHLANSPWGNRTKRGFGTRPAVLVVDDYYKAVGYERQSLLESITTWPDSCGEDGWDAIDKTVPLLAAARASKTPIIYFHGMDDFPNRSGSRGNQYAHLPEAYRPIANAIVDEIAPEEGDLVLEKPGPSGFEGTPLQMYLTQLGIDTLIVVGESTSGCVRATVVDGATKRYRVGVVEECVFDRTELSHAANLFDMNQKYADVISLDEAIAYLLTGSTEVPAPAVEDVDISEPVSV
jgi:nicotinamidase-related amidase